ncbi:hypothetical protein PVAND_015350 [Polypedilum vanderplanki]|uniref:Integrase catalytic domain-containing protein n=2 Tax=Polypedilum vanderplanki TaxID=319348 RepID=A0A9J6BCJ0_POLVA|nr:hypothetical protein PVAND_015350 [Polypedilum vanderplanki]
MEDNMSLALLTRNAEFKKNVLYKEPCTAHVKTFFLSGKYVLDSIHCALPACKLDESKKAFSTLNETVCENISIYDPFCFCYSCDRTYHVKCQNLNLSSFVDLASPFICNECFGTPLNGHAVNYYKNKAWEIGVEKRRRRFFSSETIAENPHLMQEQTLDLPFDDEDVRSFIPVEELVDSSFNDSVIALERQRLETIKITKAYKQHVDATNESLAEKEEENKKLREELNKERAKNTVQNEKSKPEKPKRVSFDHNAFDGESTRAHISRRFKITTADEILNSIAKQADRSRANNSFWQTHSSSYKTPNMSDLEETLSHIDNNSLSASDRMLLCSTRAQLQSNLAQTQVFTSMNLEIVRKNLPKIAKFKGNARGWLKFKQEVLRYKELGQYPDEVMKMIVLGALESVAESRVKDLIDVSSFSQIMEILESSFGHAPTIIKSCEDDILKYRIKGDLMRNDAVQINTLIQTYLNACSVAGVATLNTNMLATHILNQFCMMHKLLFRQHMQIKRPDDFTQMPDLEILFSFLETLAKDLEVRTEEKEVQDKPRNKSAAQVNSTVTVPAITSAQSPTTDSAKQQAEDYMFKLLDSNRAKFLGYNLELVKKLNKLCLICQSSNHFALECNKFRSMTDAQRQDCIKEKKLCQLCLLTNEHRAVDCSLKLCCGYKCSDSSRCSGKHHIILHESSLANSTPKKNTFQNRGPKRRSNTNFNSRRGRYLANDGNKSNDSRENNAGSSSSSSSAPATVPTISLQPVSEDSEKYATFPRQVQTTTCSSNRTIKIFKNIAFGPTEGTYIYSVGDSAAEISLMREDLRRQLNISGVKTSIELQWKDQKVHKIDAIKVDLEIQAIDSEELIILKDVYAVDEKNFSLPARSLDVVELKRKFPYLSEAQFESYTDAKPSLLIGTPHAACFEAIEPALQGGEGKPVAIKTRLGWSIFGGVPESYEEDNYAIEATCHVQESDDSEGTIESDRKLDKVFAYFCSLESLGITPKPNHLTFDEKMAIENIENEWKVVENGAIQVPLAWRKVNGQIPVLPNNYTVVYQRQLAHERKLKKNPVHLEAFNNMFKEQLKEGYVREATEQDIHGSHANIWYLPMTLAINERKNPVKYRNVYDASAKYQGISLNSCLLKGPKLIVDILQPHFKFRQNRVAFTCDVKSMYHRVHICPRDQQVQRILWRESDDKPMKIYIHQRMLFGPASSPFTSQLVKNKTADQWMDRHPEAAETIKSFTYMDDTLTSAKTVKQATDIAQGCIEILKSIDWDLVSFQSNSRELLKSLPHTHIKKELVELLVSETENYATKVLGCVWNPQEDCFLYKYDNDFVKASINNGHRPTKRDQASTIARMFDVRGEIAHYIIRGRILLQRSWKNKLGWDEAITEEDFKLWIKWLKDLEDIAKLRIPRQYSSYLESLAEADAIELHIFADAGKEAFAAVSYFVIEHQHVKETVFVMAKAKVTPLKSKTKTAISEMPRLEVTSCLIAARMSNTIIEYHKELTLKRFMWTDSSIVLSWIKNPNAQLERFAISPVEEILERTERDEWRHVPSELNPADIATKFQKFNFGDAHSIWFKGPKFLSLSKEVWPQQEMNKYESHEYSLLVGHIAVGKNLPIFDKVPLPSIDCEFTKDLISLTSFRIKSNWMKLVRMIGRALKLRDLVVRSRPHPVNIKIENKKKLAQFEIFELEPLDYERAELFIARHMQKEAFADEYKALVKGYLVNNKEFLPLRVFIDSQGVLRINSRVALNPEIYPQRFLPFLPRKHFLTEVLLFYYHQKYNHVGLETQVAEVRTRFWIPRLKSELTKIKTLCNYCGYMRANPQPPPMAPLPDYRINPSLKPFEVVALDCTGEMVVYKHTRKVKVYVLLFTCMLTRFVHVHLLEKMDALSVLEAICVLWTAHGPISRLISDNGRNFVGAARRIKRDEESEDLTAQLIEKRNLIKQKLAEEKKLKWEFIPPYSPWMGGAHERMIKELKRAIEFTVKKKKLSKIEFNIAIQEAAHRINCRPLTANSIDSEDQPVLTPHLLAKHRDGWPLLPSRTKCEYDNSDTNDRLIYHRGRAIADEITSRFMKEWLPMITRQCKWFKNVPDFKKGDLVLLVDPGKTRYAWPRAKVCETYAGRDGRVRILDVQLPNGEVIKRYSAQRAAKIDIQKRSVDNQAIESNETNLLKNSA